MIKYYLHKFVAVFVLTVSSLIQPVAAAENWPIRPVKIIVPIDAGTVQDLIARKLADELSSAWKQPVIIVNQPGAAGAIGTQSVANSNPDGYTLGLVSATFTGSMAVRPNLPFKRENVVGVSKFGSQSFLIFAHSKVPFNNVQEMVAYAKLNPGKIEYASPGIGSYVHLTMEHLASVKNLNLVHVPYRGIMQAAPDVASGKLHLLITTSNPTLDGFVSRGDLKIVGTTSNEKVTYNEAVVPSVSNVAPGVMASGYYGIIAPVTTPDSVVKKIQNDIFKIVNSPEFVQSMIQMGVPPSTSNVFDFDSWIDYEVDRLRKIIKQANIKLE
jgi:tripartite-type tricarboxylate transporter receptor subunit TctC